MVHKKCVKACLTGKDELHWQMDLSGNALREKLQWTGINPPELFEK